MMLNVKPFKTDVIMHAQYKESMLGLAKEDSRISLVRRLQEAFGLRLDAIKFNNETIFRELHSHHKELWFCALRFVFWA